MADQGEGEALLKSDDKATSLTVADYDLARNCTYGITFLTYVAFGIFTELYTDMFLYVIDNGNYAKASLYSTVIRVAFLFSTHSTDFHIETTSMTDCLHGLRRTELFCLADYCNSH